jgi:low affinity Fe/Cu permease
MNVWRDGDCIVIHRFGQFPDRCIFTNDFAQHYVKQSVAYPEAEPEVSTRLALAVVKQIPGFKIALAFVSVGAGLAQHRLSLRIPLSTGAFRTYQQRQWQVIIGTIIAVTIGIIAMSFVDINRYSVEVAAFLGIIGFTLMFGGLFVGGALWWQRRQLIVMKRAEQDYLWLSLGNEHSEFIPRLPQWEQKFFQQVVPPEALPPQGLGRLQSLSARWKGTIVTGLSYATIHSTFATSVRNIARGGEKIFAADIIIIIGVMALVWGFLYCIGGKTTARLLIKPGNQLTILGGLVTLVAFFLSFLVLIVFQLETEHAKLTLS